MAVAPAPPVMFSLAASAALASGFCPHSRAPSLQALVNEGTQTDAGVAEAAEGNTTGGLRRGQVLSALWICVIRCTPSVLTAPLMTALSQADQAHQLTCAPPADQ